jgi:hypothetical protein
LAIAGGGWSGKFCGSAHRAGHSQAGRSVERPSAGDFHRISRIDAGLNAARQHGRDRQRAGQREARHDRPQLHRIHPPTPFTRVWSMI